MKFPVIEVGGKPFDMGFEHGRQAEDLIRKYLEWIDQLTGKPRPELRANAMRLLPHIRQLSPAYVEEVLGLAEGARIPVEDAVLCQCRAEASHTGEGGCTAFALTSEATKDGLPLAGQNQDLESEYTDVSVILKVHPNDGRPRATMFTFAGQLGYAGMNEHGVANFVNALYNFKWQRAVPYYPIRRVLLEQRSVAEGVEVLRRHRGCSALNVVLADAKGAIADVECRPEAAVLFDDDYAHRRLHTNHYLTDRFRPFEDGFLPDSKPRLERVRHLVRKHWGAITVDVMKQILSDHEGGKGGICRHGETRMDSISGYIAEPAKGLLHVRRGFGCSGDWTVYRV
ncbi:MAG: C45 family autoproteolytic acyltransferase/hydrolase [Bryobacteraceae bacterium]